MNILEKLNIIRHHHSGIRDFCVQTIRFKKLLENANALLDLFEDGNEKINGEYILDRHYVTSLIDGVIEKLGMIVYDTCVLAPDNGEALYGAYDAHKLTAGKLINRNSASDSKAIPVGNGTGETPLSYPEYQLLSDALAWFKGEASGSTVMDLMKQSLLTGIRGIESMEALKNDSIFKNNKLIEPGGRIYMVDLWKDAVAPVTNPRSLDDIDSIPLKLLLMDAAGGTSLFPSESNRSEAAAWIAAASECEISLNAFTSDFSFRLDATASGYEKSDYIFIFAENSFNTDHILLPGFYKEKTDRGTLAWMVDVSAKTIEDSLITIGRGLFSGSAGQN